MNIRNKNYGYNIHMGSITSVLVLLSTSLLISAFIFTYILPSNSSSHFYFSFFQSALAFKPSSSSSLPSTQSSPSQSPSTSPPSSNQNPPSLSPNQGGGRSSNEGNDAATPPIGSQELDNNKAPIVDAGSDRTVNLAEGQEQAILLDGSKSRDPDGKIVFYSWKQLEGPAVICWTYPTRYGQCHFGGGVSIYPTTWVSLPMLNPGTILKFSLTVTDDKGTESNPAVITITAS
jgi:hypothetical protein